MYQTERHQVGLSPSKPTFVTFFTSVLDPPVRSLAVGAIASGSRNVFLHKAFVSDNQTGQPVDCPLIRGYLGITGKTLKEFKATVPARNGFSLLQTPPEFRKAKSRFATEYCLNFLPKLPD